jgi:hypothetical protein
LGIEQVRGSTIDRVPVGLGVNNARVDRDDSMAVVGT